MMLATCLKCSEENLEPKIIYQIWDCSLFFHLKCVLHYQAVYDILVLFIAYGRSTLEIQNNLLSFRFFFFFFAAPWGLPDLSFPTRD